MGRVRVWLSLGIELGVRLSLILTEQVGLLVESRYASCASFWPPRGRMARQRFADEW